MVGGILLVSHNELAVHRSHVRQHLLLLAHHLAPVLQLRMLDISHHQSALGGLVVGKDVDVVVVRHYRRVLVVHVRRGLYERAVLSSQVLDEEVVAVACTAFKKEHHRLFLVGSDEIEAFRFLRILVEQHVLALWSAHLVVVNLLRGIDVRELLASFRTVVGTIVEAVSLPGSTGEFCPFYMVLCQLPGLHVDDVELLPVAAAA